MQNTMKTEPWTIMGLILININNFYRPLLSKLTFSHTKTTIAMDSIMVKLDLKTTRNHAIYPIFVGFCVTTMAVDNVSSI